MEPEATFDVTLLLPLSPLVFWAKSAPHICILLDKEAIALGAQFYFNETSRDRRSFLTKDD